MHNIKLLVKNYFTIFFKRFSSKFSSKMPLYVLILIFGVLFIGMFTSLTYTTLLTAQKAGFPELALYSISMTILMFGAILIVTESSPVNKSNDEELLLSLPFTKKEIITSKVLYYLIFDAALVLLLLLPSFVLYYMMVENATIFIIFRGAYAIICVTLIACGVSSLFRIFFEKIANRFRHSDIIKSVLSTTLMIVFLIIYFIFSFATQDVTKASSVYDAYPIKLIAEFVLYAKLDYFIILTLISCIIFSLSVIVSSIFFGKRASIYKSKSLNLEFKENKVLHSLYKREINKYASIPIYVTNTIFSSIMALILGIVILVIGKDYFINILNAVIASGYESGVAPDEIINSIEGYFNFFSIMIIGLVLTTSSTTASSISLEGKEFWILKAHPISYKDVFKAKILVNLTVEGIPCMLASVLISFRIGISYLPIFVILLALISLITSIVGLYANLLCPKFDWQNEQEVVKQGISVLVSMGLSFVSVALPASLFFIIPQTEYIKFLIIIIAYIIVLLVWILILRKHGEKLYKNL